MNRLFSIVLLAVFTSAAVCAQTKAASVPVNYGSNPAAGHTFVHDGIKFYYEVYGTGEPLLVIHGNGGSIHDVAAQIAYFRKHYRVIAMDSRDQGKSGDSLDKITYEKMSDDLNALLDHLQAGPVDVLGWSDGAIEALLLGVRHPDKVKKIAAMAANLNPTDEAIYPEVIKMAKDWADSIPGAERKTPQGKREVKVTEMLLLEPHIDPKELESIKAPTLVLAGDHDLIRDEHTLEIYHHIPNSELAIFPNATHMIPFDDPATFNTTVDHFFQTPYVKKDRVKDMMSSFERMRAE